MLQALLARADVLIENFRPGVMQRLGLADADLAERHPRLIRVSITGFGADGPRAADKAYDAVIQALGGLAASQRDPATGAPVILASTISDKVTALTAAQAITAALFARERDGQGRRVEVAMLDATVAFQWPDAMYNHVWLDDPPPAMPEFGANQRAWRTADGHVATMVPQPAEFAGMCAALGRPDISAGPALRDAAGPLPQRPRAACAARAADGAVRQRDARGTLPRPRRGAGPCQRAAEVLSDPQVLHNQAVVTVDNGAAGRVRVARGAARFDGQPMAPLRGGARLGEHSIEVLRELGIDDAQIAALVEQGVVRVPAAPDGAE